MSRSRTARPGRRRTIVTLISLLAGSLFLVPLARADTGQPDPGRADAATERSASVQELPLGKERFAVAIGGLRANSTENWVRLGLYEFTADGTVTEEHWHWTQRRRVTRSYTGRQPGDCPARNCEVATARGYESSSAPQELKGSYTVTGDRLEITWERDIGTETWRLAPAADGSLATLELVDAGDFGGTHGYGYGSNAGWDERASAGTVAGDDHERFEHQWALWKTTGSDPDPHVETGSGSPFWITDWTTCGDGCLGARSSTPTEYYVSPANGSNQHRRDTLWHWRTSLADGRGEYCYTGNSHVKPMVQIVDDEGDFHGWVGVEASLNQTVPDQGALADDIGVFRIAAY